MDDKALIEELRKHMDKAIAALHHDLRGVRTGRASASLLDHVMIEGYGGERVHLNQMSTVSVPEARLITIQVWDKSMVKSVEKAIVAADLGLNPMADGQLIRISLPALSEERRKELVKIAHKYGENSKIAVRNIRRDSIEQVKKLEKDSKISEDQMHQFSNDIQKITDEFNEQITKTIANKEKDIMGDA